MQEMGKKDEHSGGVSEGVPGGQRMEEPLRSLHLGSLPSKDLFLDRQGFFATEKPFVLW
jgi:hypothetical protein